jgi:hypothetical protein
MPPLRETKLQIEEDWARGIRQRTAARVAELVKAEGDARQAREDIRVEVDIIQENKADVDTPRQCEGCRQLHQLCFRLQCERVLVLFLFFVYCLYHAHQTR